jgi:hypothetical protein
LSAAVNEANTQEKQKPRGNRFLKEIERIQRESNEKNPSISNLMAHLLSMNVDSRGAFFLEIDRMRFQGQNIPSEAEDLINVAFNKVVAECVGATSQGFTASRASSVDLIRSVLQRCWYTTIFEVALDVAAEGGIRKLQKAGWEQIAHCAEEWKHLPPEHRDRELLASRLAAELATAQGTLLCIAASLGESGITSILAGGAAGLLSHAAGIDPATATAIGTAVATGGVKLSYPQGKFLSDVRKDLTERCYGLLHDSD